MSSNSETSAFTQLVNASMVRRNRREILRLSAVTAAAASMSLKAVYAQDQSTPESTPGSTADFTLRLPFNPFGQ